VELQDDGLGSEKPCWQSGRSRSVRWRLGCRELDHRTRIVRYGLWRMCKTIACAEIERLATEGSLAAEQPGEVC
jgi:hypothetical protein